MNFYRRSIRRVRLLAKGECPIRSAVEKVLTVAPLMEALASRRARGERIVFTNGCFDILHVGHVRYLEQARALGELLVVGVNSDASARALKGPQRPIIPEDERAELLAHLVSVDYVCLFEELRPDALIAQVRPAVHVKGGDYDPETLPEAEIVRRHGGSIVIVPFVEGHSTTRILAGIAHFPSEVDARIVPTPRAKP
jgi:rfaE bifunctional protein nucleotidyltransferase chain/domain